MNVDAIQKKIGRDQELLDDLRGELEVWRRRNEWWQREVDAIAKERREYAEQAASMQRYLRDFSNLCEAVNAYSLRLADVEKRIGDLKDITFLTQRMRELIGILGQRMDEHDVLERAAEIVARRAEAKSQQEPDENDVL